MADIEIGPLHDRLDDSELKDLAKALKKAGAPDLPKSDEGASGTIGGGIDDDVMAEFLDRLEAHDIACEIYLPAEFEGRVEVGDLRIGSASTLIDVLDELKDDLAIEEDEDEDADEDEEEEEEEYGEMELIESQLRQLWRLFYQGAHAAMDRGLPMYVRGG